jgi:hypothetical protein
MVWMVAWMGSWSCILVGGVLTLYGCRKSNYEERERCLQYVPRCQWAGCRKVASSYSFGCHRWFCGNHEQRKNINLEKDLSKI